MDTVYKILENCEVKKVGERQYEFIASTDDMDRDGEVIDVNGWDLKNFKKNPVIMFAHDYRTLPIGKATKIGVHDGKLVDVVEFPPEGTYEFADTVARLVDAGYLKTQSVGFIPKKWDDGDFSGDEAQDTKKPRRIYTKQELLEISIVPVPSNPNALRNAVDNGVITLKQFEAITKPEVTDEFIRIPVRTCEVTATIDISEKEGISALYCGKEKKVRTYLFRKDKGWDMEKAKAWVKEHDGKGVGSEEEGITIKEEKQKKAVSQSQIVDEIDYLKSLIDKVGAAEATLKSLNDSIGGYLKQMNMDKMQEMHDMMESCETMAEKSKNMAEDMMAEMENMDNQEGRNLGSDIPINKNDKSDDLDILEAIQTTKLGGK